MNMIEKAIKFVEDFFRREFSGHDYFHTLRVYKMATYIAQKENANLEMVQLAALLHDVDDRKISPETCENKDNARRFLAENGVDGETINEIVKIISDISFAGKDSVIPATIEGKCAQDADRLDAIGAVGIARAFAYGGNHNRLMYDPEVKPNENMGKEEYYRSQSTTINHFYEKLLLLTDIMNTPTAKEIAMGRERYMKEYIEEFMAEWEGLR